VHSQHSAAHGPPSAALDRADDFHGLTPAPQLTIERQQDSQRVLLVLHGEIDLASAPQLDCALVEAVSTGPSRIGIDLADVQFIDSTGLRALIQGKERAQATGRSLILRHVRPQAKRLFEVTGVARALGVG
jgi:anti-anti-sigma factor